MQSLGKAAWELRVAPSPSAGLQPGRESGWLSAGGGKEMCDGGRGLHSLPVK